MKQLNVRLPDKLVEGLKAFAKAKKVEVQMLIHRLVRQGAMYEKVMPEFKVISRELERISNLNYSIEFVVDKDFLKPTNLNSEQVRTWQLVERMMKPRVVEVIKEEEDYSMFPLGIGEPNE
jgi:hypothetical protein